MRSTLLIALALSACVKPEEGIGDDRLRGTVRVGPTSGEEAANFANRNFSGAEAIADVTFGYHLHSGVIDGYGVEGWRLSIGGRTPTRTYSSELSSDADQDWFSIVSPDDHEMAMTISWAGGATLRVGLYDLDDIQGGGPGNPERPALLSEADFTGSGSLSWSMEGGHNYGIRVAGVAGSEDTTYEMVFPGVHPDEAGILAGAYLPAEGGGAPVASARSNPVAGSNVGPFELLADVPYTYEASYEAYLVREVNTTEDTGDGTSTTTNEFVTEVWTFAGDWTTLQPRLAAGTWFSSTPVQILLDGNPKRDDEAGVVYYEAAEPLVLDSIAPAVIGHEIDEVEPNDMPFDEGAFVLDTSDPAKAFDIGSLSGDGYIDILNGHIDFFSADSGFVHDIDAYKFTVPQHQTVYFVMDWEDPAADIDVVIHDSAGDPLDWAASLEKPEMSGGYADMYPEETYYLVVLGYAGTEGASMAYNVRIENAGL